ncbi:hypothetical protein C0585_08485 [Candidatus Woesearchaeota archaeon]|nr:MAG: hypothetical protein C0585_08485 [Candidatus Woesearchaeota archaeon]
MDDEKIVLDKKTFKALAVDSRIDIMKLLNTRQHTLTEISETLGYSNSTVKEHLDVLVKADLIKQKDEGRKWKYYKLTFKGKNFINPKEIKVLFAFTVSTIAAVSSTIYMVKPFMQSTTQSFAKVASDEAMLEAAPMMARTLSEPIVQNEPSLTVPLAILGASLLLIGFSLGYIFKKNDYIIKGGNSK